MMGNSKKRWALSISTYFCIPEQGMKDLEILCRASAFLVKSKNDKNRFHLLTASHAVAPWLYPKYYPDEWLQFVNHTHTHYSIEFRSEDGTFITQTEMTPATYHHSTRDLAVLHPESNLDFLKTLTRLGVDIQELSNHSLTHGDKLNFHGHELSSFSNRNATQSNFGEVENIDVEESDSESGDNRLPIPCVAMGTAMSIKRQLHARTNSLLSFGMCGGPVTAMKSNSSSINSSISPISSSNSSSSQVICGLLESVEPTDSENIELRGLASIVDNNTISK